MKLFLKNILLTFISCLIFTLFVNHASAHQPNYINSQSEIYDNAPDISKAYYGELTGSPAIYYISSKEDFLMYVGILSPDIPDATKDFQVKILNNSNETMTVLNSPTAPWSRWYETFAGDWYWQGPEFKREMPAGNYLAEVTNWNNTGKYVLAVGEKESFPVSQTTHTISELYKTKTKFFGEPWFGIFGGIIGKFLLGALLLFALIILLLLWLIKRRPHRPR